MSFRRRWRELNDEMDTHRRLAAADGFPPGSRDRAPDATREAVRDQWAWRWADDAVRDLRFAIRGLCRAPGFALAAVLTLALGIAATTAMFSLVNGVLLRPLPYPQPHQLVAADQWYPAGAFAWLRSQARTLDVAAYTPGRSYNLREGRLAESWTGNAVSANWFTVLGSKPALGQTFARGDDQPGHEGEVVLSYLMWRQRFHASPAVLGRIIEIGGAAREIVGVMPSGFAFPSAQTRFWIPLDLNPAATGQYWAGTYMPVIARMRPRVSLHSARAEWRSLRPQLLAAYGWPMPADAFRGAALVPLRSMLVGSIASRLWLLLGAVGLLLLIACVNVANLILARAATRRREMDLRVALGAGRGRLLRQLFTESLLLAALGAAAGIALAAAGLPLLKQLLPPGMPRLAAVSLDGRVWLLVAAVAVLCAVAFGFCGYRGESRRRAARQAGAAAPLVVIEVALSALLVVLAGLNARSLQSLAAVNPGFDRAGVLTARLAPNPLQCQPAARCQSLYQAIVERVRALPGVTSAAVVNALPLGGSFEVTTFQIAAHPTPRGQRHPLAFGQIVTPGYFAAMRIPLLRGRRFAPGDMVPGAPPVVILSRATAARLWPGKSALGQLFKSDGEHTWRKVIGIVGNVQVDAVPGSEPASSYFGVYSPYAHPMLACAPCATPPKDLTLVIRSASGRALNAATLRAVVASVAPATAISRMEPLSVWTAAALRSPRSITGLFVLAAVLALLLGAAGLYGVLAYQVARRRREIGVRLALGAQRRTVLAGVVRHGLKLAAIGLAAGLALALALGQLLAGLLYGFSPRDPVTYAAVAVLWLLTALAASLVPARRATRVDPARTLRCE